MNRERAKELWPVIKAWGDGLEVQSRRTAERPWLLCAEENGDFNLNDGWEYRIKPAPKLRAWKAEEVPVGRIEFMYPRTNYEMTEADLEKILDACKPVPMIMLNISSPRSPQERANDAWAELGSRMGFDSMTVEPIAGKEPRFFTAIPNEPESVRAARVELQKEEAQRADIERIKGEIKALEDKLTALLNP